MGGRIKKKEKKDKGTCPETQIDLEFGPTAAARDFQNGPMRVNKWILSIVKIFFI